MPAGNFTFTIEQGATTDFEINYEVISKNQTISTPLGKFKECLYLKGTGNTKFIRYTI